MVRSGGKAFESLVAACEEGGRHQFKLWSAEGRGITLTGAGSAVQRIVPVAPDALPKNEAPSYRAYKRMKFGSLIANGKQLGLQPRNRGSIPRRSTNTLGGDGSIPYEVHLEAQWPSARRQIFMVTLAEG